MRSEAEIKRAIELLELALRSLSDGNGHVQACLFGLRWVLGEKNVEAESVDILLSRLNRLYPQQTVVAE